MWIYWILGTIGLMVIFQLLKAYYHFYQLKDRIEYELEKVNFEIEDNPDQPIFLIKRASLLMQIQRFKSAHDEYVNLLSILNETSPIKDVISVKGSIKINIEYCKKPLPWSIGDLKNRENNWFLYFLIDRLGGQRIV